MLMPRTYLYGLALMAMVSSTSCMAMRQPMDQFAARKYKVRVHARGGRAHVGQTYYRKQWLLRRWKHKAHTHRKAK